MTSVIASKTRIKIKIIINILKLLSIITVYFVLADSSAAVLHLARAGGAHCVLLIERNLPMLHTGCFTTCEHYCRR